MDIQSKLIAKRYAMAYMSAIQNDKKAKEEFFAVHKAIEPYLNYFYNPCINSETKNKILDKILPDNEKTPQIKNFIKVLISSKRINLLPLIAKEIKRIYELNAGIENIKLYCRFDLPESSISAIEKLVKELTGRKATFEKMTKPDIIGGFQIEFGDFFIDSSIRAKLNSIKKNLLG